jgi:hypothetical protein
MGDPDELMGSFRIFCGCSMLQRHIMPSNGIDLQAINHLGPI